MNELVTAFEITASSNGLLADALLGLAMGLVGLIAGIGAMVLSRRQQGVRAKLASAIFLIGWVVIWSFVEMPLWRIVTIETHRLLSVYRSGGSEITEGVVHVTHQQPAHGHSSGDKIVIGDKKFEVDYFLVTPGYRQTIARGGVLREGVFARLHHHHGVILKVEVRKTG